MSETGEGPKPVDLTPSAPITAPQVVQQGSPASTESSPLDQSQLLVDTRAKDMTMQRRGRRVFSLLRRGR